MSKKLIGSVIVAVVVIGSGLVWYRSSSNSIDSYEVVDGEVFNKTTLVGTVKANQDLDLGFEVSGKVAEVLVNENQFVEEGTRLISLNINDLLAQRTQAYANLREAQSSLKQQAQQVELEKTRLEDLKSGGSSQEIRVAETTVDLRKEELERAEKLLEEGLADNVRALESLIDETRITLDSSLNQALSSLYNLTDIQFAVYPQADSESVRVGYHKALAAEILVGIRDSERFRTQVISEAKGGLVEKLLNTDVNSSDQSLELLRELKSGLNEVSNAFLYFSLDDDVSEATRSQIESQKSIVASEIATLNNLEQRFLNTLRNNQSSETNLRSNVMVAERSLAQAEADLKRVRDGADDNDLRIQEIAVEQANSLLESREARVQFENGRIQSINADIQKRSITAPIDGTVVDLEIAEGEIVSLSERVVTLQAENDLLIEVDSPERYLRFLNEGQEVEVMLEAYPSDTLVGVVVRINKESSLTDNVPVFKVDIKLEPGDLDVRSGMTGDVVLTLEEAEGLLINNIDVIRENKETFVNVIKDYDPFTIEKRKVRLGVVGTNGMVEVLEGLSAGEEILVNGSND